MKISPEFEARLAARGADEVLRAVVVLAGEAAPEGLGRRALKARRQAMLEAAAARVEAARGEIASILERHGGRPLDGHLGPLGGLAVETTPAGIRALAELDAVSAVMEDQGIASLAK